MPALPSELAEFGEISGQDLIVPRILVMQGLSDMVANGEAKLGELRENVSNTMLGSIDKPLEIIPFRFEKVWRVHEDGHKEPKEIIPLIDNPSHPGYNGNLPFEFADPETGVAMKRYRTYRFFVLLPSKIKLMPYMVEFKSTSMRAGQKIVNRAMENNRDGKRPYATVFDLVVSKQQNKKGTYAVIDVKPKRDITTEEGNEVAGWMARMKSQTIVVSEDEVD